MATGAKCSVLYPGHGTWCLASIWYLITAGWSLVSGAGHWVPCSPIRYLPYPIPPIQKSREGAKKVEKTSSQNWACLVWKFLMELVGVFCTYLGAPNCHIVKNPKKSENLPIFLFALFSPYFPGLEVSYRALWYDMFEFVE